MLGNVANETREVEAIAAHSALRLDSGEEQARIVIGRTKDIRNLEEGEESLLSRLPNRGGAKANWKQNAGVLRPSQLHGVPRQGRDRLHAMPARHRWLPDLCRQGTAAVLDGVGVLAAPGIEELSAGGCTTVRVGRTAGQRCLGARRRNCSRRRDVGVIERRQSTVRNNLAGKNIDSGNQNFSSNLKLIADKDWNAGVSNLPRWGRDCYSVGSLIVNVAPFPSPGLAAVTVPPCSSTMCFTRARPSPRPPNRLESAWE